MLEAHVIPELKLGLMVQAIWDGDYNRENRGEYVLYRDLGGRDENDKPNRELLPPTEWLGIVIPHYSDKVEEYENLLFELRDILATDESYIDVRDLRTSLAPWLDTATVGV